MREGTAKTQASSKNKVGPLPTPKDLETSPLHFGCSPKQATGARGDSIRQLPQLRPWHRGNLRQSMRAELSVGPWRCLWVALPLGKICRTAFWTPSSSRQGWGFLVQITHSIPTLAARQALSWELGQGLKIKLQSRHLPT